MFRYSLMVDTALILMLSLCTSLPASAGPYDSGQQQFQVAEHFAPRPPPRGKRVEPREARLNDRQAAERVKRTFEDHKILSVNMIESKGPVVYRVKTLSQDGVIKYVFVDGDSGEVFD